jgi:hypothetical protein
MPVKILGLEIKTNTPSCNDFAAQVKKTADASRPKIAMERSPRETSSADVLCHVRDSSADLNHMNFGKLSQYTFVYGDGLNASIPAYDCTPPSLRVVYRMRVQKRKRLLPWPDRYQNCQSNQHLPGTDACTLECRAKNYQGDPGGTRPIFHDSS